MSGPLAGVTVLELIQKGPGAFVTMMMADMGADVIKIETPSRARASGSGGSASTADARAQVTNVVNRGKRSLVLDLKHPDGKAVLQRLACEVDVLVEGFRPGVTARLGADFATLSAIAPRLIYCSLSGFGQDGPYRDLPGHDLNYIGIAGILDMIGEADQPPTVPPNLIADFGGAAMHAVAGISMALFARERTGRGQMIDIAYLDAALSLISSTRVIREYLGTGQVPQRGIGAFSGNYPYYGVYRAKDGKYITIGCIEPWLWENLCNALDRPDLIEAGMKPTDFGDPASEVQRTCRSALETVFAQRTRDEWFALLCDRNICVGKVNDLAEMFDDPQLRHREMILRMPHPELGEVFQIGIPIKMSDTAGEVRGFAPWKGQHSQPILTGLGYTESEIARLAEQNVI